MHAETALSRVNAFSLLQNFQINALGPILVSRDFAPLLGKAATASGASRWLMAPSSAVLSHAMCFNPAVPKNGIFDVRSRRQPDDNLHHVPGSGLR